MRIVCPHCATGYEVAESAIGPNGRKVRCRACGTSWVQAPESAQPAPAPAEEIPPPPSTQLAVLDPDEAEWEPIPETPVPPRKPWRIGRFLRGPLVLLGLALAVILLGLAIAFATFGSKKVAGAFGLGGGHVPLGISITRQPDWRMIAGGSELFAVSGKIWNPTDKLEPIPNIRAELKDAGGKTVYSWIIARPQRWLTPHATIDFDGAAVDVPRSSQRVSVSFVAEGN